MDFLWKVAGLTASGSCSAGIAHQSQYGDSSGIWIHSSKQSSITTIADPSAFSLRQLIISSVEIKINIHIA